MADFSMGFKGYEKAEDIHGQIRLCKENGGNMLHLKNMNFNFACKYNASQAKQLKLLLDREGVRALSLYISDSVTPENAKMLADIYGVEYLTVGNDGKKQELSNVFDGEKIIVERQEN